MLIALALAHRRAPAPEPHGASAATSTPSATTPRRRRFRACRSGASSSLVFVIRRLLRGRRRDPLLGAARGRPADHRRRLGAARHHRRDRDRRHSLAGGKGKIAWTFVGVLFFVLLSNTLNYMRPLGLPHRRREGRDHPRRRAARRRSAPASSREASGMSDADPQLREHRQELLRRAGARATSA